MAKSTDIDGNTKFTINVVQQPVPSTKIGEQPRAEYVVKVTVHRDVEGSRGKATVDETFDLELNIPLDVLLSLIFPSTKHTVAVFGPRQSQEADEDPTGTGNMEDVLKSFFEKTPFGQVFTGGSPYGGTPPFGDRL